MPTLNLECGGDDTTNENAKYTRVKLKSSKLTLKFKHIGGVQSKEKWNPKYRV